MELSLKLDNTGILTVAVHDGSLDDIGTLFGRFQRSNRRTTLYIKLKEYVHALRNADIPGWLIVDGSFVMGCVDEPEDIDIVLVLAPEWDLTAELKPFQYNLVSKRDVKRNFPIEVFTVLANSDSEKQWTDFFLRINTKWYEPHGFTAGSQKGLVRIKL